MKGIAGNLCRALPPVVVVVVTDARDQEPPMALARPSAAAA